MENKTIVQLSQAMKDYNSIDKSLYDKYDIKRGLRNKDGTGVLVGITGVGDVVGYKIVDGKKVAIDGNLFYRGYSILDLVKGIQESERFGFEEVVYLLLFNKLPNQIELESFNEILVEERKLPNNFLEDVILKVPGTNIMNKMMRSMLSLYAYDNNPDSLDSLNVLYQSMSLISKLPLIMAYAYQGKKHYIDKESLVIHFPDDNKSLAENILHLIRNNEYTQLEAKILDLLLIVHAEHGGGNNSAFATHVVSSSATDTYSSIAAGLASLKGPRHGGANLKACQMIEDIYQNVDISKKDQIKDYLVKILDKKSFDKKGLIYGLGHAVYTLSDPRAVLLKEQARILAAEKNQIEIFNLIENIEMIGGKLVQEKIKKDYRICANVDLYSGFVYQMLEIPKELYTPLFAVSRMAGWCAHRLEQIQDEKIIRPAYMSMSVVKKYKNLEKR